MAAFNFNMVVFLAMVALLALYSSAMQHTVGDIAGWAIPSSPGFYNDWAAGQQFTVGDSLVFNFQTGKDDVTKVSRDEYNQCYVGNPESTITSGPATINLTSPGDHYYISSIVGHCTYYQQLAIVVNTVDKDATLLGV